VERVADRAVKNRVSQQSGLDQIGLGDAQVGIERLDLPTVQQRHLDCLVGRQRVVEQRLHLLGHVGVQLGAEVPHHPFPTPGVDCRTDVWEPGPLVKGGATG
jgi:hypothetical protein